MMRKQDVIRALGLAPHFEGGYFAETFRPDAATKIVTARGERLAMTAIYFMLDDASAPVAFHSKHSDGIQFHLKGDPVTYHLIHPDGTYEKIVLGQNIDNGQCLQLAVAGGTWKALELESGDYGLVSEVVSPGWELEDVVETNRQALSTLFPQHAEVISRLTHV